MEVIRAKVSERLLSKAERLFTGTVDGRVIEVLQNARRAGATEVHIVNSDGEVTVCDNGKGIADSAAREGERLQTAVSGCVRDRCLR